MELRTFQRNGKGVLPNVMSPLAATLRSFQELVAGNAKFKRHRSMKQKLRWNCQGCSITDLRLFLEELLSQKGAEEPIVESGGVYGVSADFDRMNTDLVLTELACDARFKRLDRDDFSRLMGFFTEVFGNRHLRNRNPLHFSVIDCCLISNTLNVPKQIFGFPFACYATDGLEAMSLVLFASKARNTPAERPVVLYAVGADRKRRDFEIRQCCRRIGLEPVRLPTMSILSTPKSVRDRCVVVLGVALDGASISELSQSAARAKLSVHLHVIDAQFRRIFSENADDRLVHLRLPENVRSVSVEEGMLSCGYALYRDADLRDLHMDVAIQWQTLYLSPNEGGSGSSQPMYVDFCLWLLGWNALRRVAISPAASASEERRTIPRSMFNVERFDRSEVVEYSNLFDIKSFENILNLAKYYITEDWSGARRELMLSFIKFQMQFVGGHRRSSIEASVTGGGTRSINMAFETVLERARRSRGFRDWTPRVVTGNPHLAVERAERRFGFRVVRVAEEGVISIPKFREAVRHDDVVAVYSQTLSYTDGTSDPLRAIAQILETENLRRESLSMPPVVHINDCCLAFNVLVCNDGLTSSRPSMRVLDFDTKRTPIMVTIDAHKHMGAEKGISTVFGTAGTLSSLEESVRVGAEPSVGALARTIANLSLMGHSGYSTLYRRLQAAVARAIQKLEAAGLRLVRSQHRRVGSTVMCFEDPSGAVGNALSKRGFVVGRVYNLFDGSPNERAKSPSAWQLSVTPHHLRPAPARARRARGGSLRTALDVFVAEAIDVHRKVSTQWRHRLVRAVCSERSFVAHALSDNLGVYVFSKIAGGGVARQAGMMLARRYCSPLLDGGSLFCRDETYLTMENALKNIFFSVLYLSFSSVLVVYFCLDWKIGGYALVSLLLFWRWAMARS